MNLQSNLRSAILLVMLMASAMITPTSQPAHAGGPWYVVPGGNDGNDCLTPSTPCATINGAMGKAQSGDAIKVAIGTYSGSGAEVVWINKSVTLSGGWNGTFTAQNGISTIEGEGARRGINVSKGVAAVVERMVVQHGYVVAINSSGGGIYNGGVLTLNASTVSNNRTAFGVYGGGIGNGGVLTLTNSTITDNRGYASGGGIYNDVGASVIITNSRLISNKSDFGSGGGIANFSGIVTLTTSVVNNNSAYTGGGGIASHLNGALYISNSTISGNSAGYHGGGIGSNDSILVLNSSTVGDNRGLEFGGLVNNGGTATLQNTLVANNFSSWRGSASDCGGPVYSAGYNLMGTTSNCTFITTTGDLRDINPGMYPLVSVYEALQPDSPAIDAGNPAGCFDVSGNILTTDQRGVVRPLDGNDDGNTICDIGAYEFDPSNNPISQVFLPLAALNHDFCPNFFDDFSDPSSGWPVGEDSFVRAEYLNGEYRVLSKQADYFFFFRAPTRCDHQDYVVEVDAHWVGTSGNSYGLLFGISGDFSQFYIFDMNADYQAYRILRVNADGSISGVLPVSSSSIINRGTQSNNLRVRRSGSQITLQINGLTNETLYDRTITGITGVGLVASSSSDNATADVRFDNFSVTTLGNGAATSGASSLGLAAANPMAPSKRIMALPVDSGGWPPQDNPQP